MTLAALGALALGVLAPTSANADEADELNVVDGVTTNLDLDTAADLDAFVLSDAPKEVTIDPATGEITEVLAVTPGFQILSTPSNSCGASSLCLNPVAPYKRWGFTGTGISNGNWPGINSWDTGNRAGRVDTNIGPWSAWIGANTRGIFGAGQTVTVTAIDRR